MHSAKSQIKILFYKIPCCNSCKLQNYKAKCSFAKHITAIPIIYKTRKQNAFLQKHIIAVPRIYKPTKQNAFLQKHIVVVPAIYNLCNFKYNIFMQNEIKNP